MPYRRLPNTDRARIKAMQAAVDMEYKESLDQLAISLKVINRTRTFLQPFVKAHDEYQQSYERQVKASRKHLHLVKMARLYVSHFIQVLNMCVLRGEIKREIKECYGLEVATDSLPDLTSEVALVEWGDKVIKGEEERRRHGGTPIYNPTIAKVQVYYDQFKESHISQRKLQQSTARTLEVLTSLRHDADQLILQIWNEVEHKYENLPPQERLAKCQGYGVVYYYRKHEKEKQEFEKVQNKITFDD